jgi:hypothetical protein
MGAFSWPGHPVYQPHAYTDARSSTRALSQLISEALTGAKQDASEVSLVEVEIGTDAFLGVLRNIEAKKNLPIARMAQLTDGSANEISVFVVEQPAKRVHTRIGHALDDLSVVRHVSASLPALLVAQEIARGANQKASDLLRVVQAASSQPLERNAEGLLMQIVCQLWQPGVSA